jgi:hypothetical protein
MGAERSDFGAWRAVLLWAEEAHYIALGAFAFPHFAIDAFEVGARHRPHCHGIGKALSL